MIVFLDIEMTNLRKDGVLISIALVPMEGMALYCFNKHVVPVDLWIQKNVIDNLQIEWIGKGQWVSPAGRVMKKIDLEVERMSGGVQHIAAAVNTWLAKYDEVTIWGDVPAYDWVHFCDLFGGAFKIPKNVFYIPFDIATALKMKGYDPDVEREVLAPGIPGPKHNALHDALVERDIYRGVLFHEAKHNR